MAKGEQPKQEPTPAPLAEDVTDRVAADLMTERLKSRAGRKASFLTKGQRTGTKTNSLLGAQSDTLGTK